MTTTSRLAAIGLLAPAIVHVVGAVTYTSMMLFTAPVSYPLMVVVTFALLIPFHVLFRRRRMSPWTQLPVIAIGGLLGGLLVQVFVFQSPPLGPHVFASRTAWENLVLGLSAALMCWLLYNWGPMSVVGKRKYADSKPTAIEYQSLGEVAF